MVDARVDELWKEVLAVWDDDARHLAFVEHCRTTSQLGAAAARYRAEAARAAGDPADARRAESAEKRLCGITTLALMELSRAASPEARAASRLVPALRVVVALMLAFAIALYVWVSR